MNDSNRNGARIAAIILLGIASLGAGYLLVRSLSEGPVAGCGDGSSCGSVLKSRWAYALPGIPVTAPALLNYLVLLFALIVRPPAKVWSTVLQVGALLIIGAALWFVGLQVFALKAFCKWCMGTHLTGVLGAGFILSTQWSAPRQPLRRGLAFAAAGVVALAVCQLFLPQKTTVQTQLGTESFAESDHEVTIASFKLDLTELPYRGNPRAEKRLLFMFDYTCSSCRRVHEYMTRAEARFGKDNYLVVMLPTPLNPECNRYYEKASYDHRNACLFASMALAMWWKDKEKFYEFDRWLIEAGTAGYPPTAEAARVKAEELLGGKEALAVALADPRIRAELSKLTSMWNVVKSRSGRLVMPKLLTASGSLSEGAPDNDSALFEILEKTLDLKPLN